MNQTHIENSLLLVVGTVLLSLFVISCGGSSDDPLKTQDPLIFPPAVFVADKDLDGVDELYAAFDDGNEIVKLSNALGAGGNVVAFLVSPDGFFVAYVADQDTNGVFELYSVVVDKTIGDTAVKVSRAMAGSGVLRLPSGEYSFGWAPDSSRVAYIADQNSANVFELFTAPPDGQENDLVSDLPDPATNPDRDVKDFEWEPDSTLIAYVANQNDIDKFELYVSPSDSNIGNRRVSGFPVAGSGVRENPPVPIGEYLFGWAPDSSRLAYVADRDVAGVFELFSTTPDGGSILKLSGPMGANGDVDEIAWAPDNSRIAYLADQINDEGIELYTALPNVSPSFFKNSTGIGAGSNVTRFEWAPNSLRIAFIANKVDPRFALYTTGSDDSFNVLVSSILLADSEVLSFGWAPDGSRIAYIADEISINVLELFTTRPAAPLITKISGNLVAGGDVLGFQWAPNSSRVAYTADQDENDVFELYSSTPDGGVNDILSDVMAPGGDVQDFKWAPDSSGVAYLADQDINNVIELFASQPNGNNNTKLSGTLVNGGDVLVADWVP
jgi:Tol biopolymer transport system component